MGYRWPDYDPTLKALLHPEESHPEGLHSEGDGWPCEAVCAEFARLAYFRFETKEGKAQLDLALSKAGFGEAVPFDPVAVPAFGNWFRRKRQQLRERNAQAFAATRLDGKLTILAYRGTQADEPKDLVTDLMAWRTPLPGGAKVHTGFWLAYRELAKQIDPWLADLKPRKLVVTGHSLGAAMATIMAALHEEAKLVTFGCPLVGNRKFGEAFGREALRYVDCTDFVTTVPYGFLGYEHFGEMRYVDRHGVVHRSPPAETLKRDREQAKEWYRRTCAGVPGNVPVRNFADHAPVNYVSAVSGMRSPLPE
jgi:pimeloyl-ACP methyl ester carboxylesterase